jgi:hypothetical protein
MRVMMPMAMGMTALDTATGRPITRILRQDCSSGRSPGQGEVSRCSRRDSTQRATTSVKLRASTVAQAAPAIPSAGMGPQPKMSRGSIKALSRTPTIMTTLGVRVSPVARIMLLPIMGTT